MTRRTYSVEEYAAELRGPGPDGTAETLEYCKVRWLERRLRGDAEPKLPGFKAGGRWRGTQAHVDEALRLLEERSNRLPPIPDVSSMSRTSRRRVGL